MKDMKVVTALKLERILLENIKKKKDLTVGKLIMIQL